MQDCTDAIRLEPNLAAAYNNRGTVRFDKGDLKGALQDYTEAMRLEPGPLALLHSNRGLARLAKGDKQGALQDYWESIRLINKAKE